jgi:hypothetical protein
MDPNLFHLDWERVAEVLAGIVILAFVLERGLALLFETRFFIERAQGKNLKELIAFVLSVIVCWYWDFDAISMIFLKEKTTLIGIVVTGGVIAGGSKGAIRLFKDIMGFMSEAEKERQNKRKPQNGKEEKPKGGKKK